MEERRGRENRNKIPVLSLFSFPFPFLAYFPLFSFIFLLIFPSCFPLFSSFPPLIFVFPLFFLLSLVSNPVLVNHTKDYVDQSIFFFRGLMKTKVIFNNKITRPK